MGDTYIIVEPGNFAYNPYRINVGSLALLEGLSPGLVSPAYVVFSVRSDSDLDSRFLLLLLKGDRWQREIKRMSMSRGSVRRSLSFRDLAEFEILLPPLTEQRAIVRALRTVQQASEATERILDATRELKRSLTRHLFTYGLVPVYQADRVELQETEIGPIPAYWRVTPIERVITGTQYGTSSRAEMDGRYPMLRMNNLVDGQMDVTDLKYIDLDDAEFEKFRVHRGDVLFNRTNSFELVGKTSLFDRDGKFVFASYLVRVVADPRRCLPEYLNCYLNWQTAQRRLKQLATRGVSQSNINATKLRGFRIGLPPLAEQGEIVRILSTVDAKIAAEEARRDALNDLFHSLLHHLMTGKVRTQ